MTQAKSRREEGIAFLELTIPVVVFFWASADIVVFEKYWTLDGPWPIIRHLVLIPVLLVAGLVLAIRALRWLGSNGVLIVLYIWVIIGEVYLLGAWVRLVWRAAFG